MLVIAHLNISDNSFNISSEFAALPDFTFMHLFLFPHLNHTRDLEPAKLVHFKEDIFLLTPFRLDHPYYSDLFFPESGCFQQAVRVCHCISLIDGNLENTQIQTPVGTHVYALSGNE